MPRPTQGAPDGRVGARERLLGRLGRARPPAPWSASVAYLSDSRRLAAEKRASAVLVLSHEAPPSQPATVGGK